MVSLLLGTSSFTANGWRGTLYPRGLKAADYLAYYAEHFSTVEIDSTFYACPAERTVANLGARVPEGFVFAVKVPQVITHEKVLRDCGAELGFCRAGSDWLVGLKPDAYITHARALSRPLVLGRYMGASVGGTGLAFSSERLRSDWVVGLKPDAYITLLPPRTPMSPRTLMPSRTLMPLATRLSRAKLDATLLYSDKCNIDI